MKNTLLAATVLLAASAAQAAPPAERWLYCPVNMLVDANIQNTEALFARAGQAGYTHVLLADTKLHKLADMDPRYLKNVERIKQSAQTRKLQIVPAVFPIGYSAPILWHDPNLAEALPVKEVPLIVNNGLAQLVLDPAVALKGGDFSNLKLWTFHDPTVSYDAAEKALRITAADGKNSRIAQKLKLTPFRQYHVSLRIKTSDFKGTPEVKVLAEKPKVLNFQTLNVKPTQDWSTVHITFNTLENTDVTLYIGCWNGKSGTCWVADAKIEESPFVNMVRRAGAPLVIKDASGKPLVEGKDFDPFTDPLMGTKPWKGSYDIYHTPPALKVKSPEGARLTASYYYVPTIHDNQVGICPSEKKTVDLLRDEAERIHKLFGAKAYFMSHDEIRVWNWCEACQKRNLSAGEILADNVRTCTRILQETAPGAKIYVWSDMFDPNHNAHDNYYLARGDFKDSWAGLDKSVNIALWYSGKAKESMTFFGDRGHRMMIAGYYDGPVANVQRWLDAADTAGQGKIDAIMYTTWKSDYSQLEAFNKAISAPK